LAKKGHQVSVVASSSQTSKKKIRNLNFYLTKERTLIKFWFFCWKILSDKIISKVEIIHGCDLFHLPFCLKKNSAKIITTCHNSYWQRMVNYGWKRKIYYPPLILLEQFIFSRTNRIISVSPFGQKFIRQYLAIKNKIKIVPNGVETDIFRPQESDYLQRKLSIKRTDKIALFVGRLAENKRPLFLISLAKKYFPKKCHLVLVGDGPLKGRIKEAISGNQNLHLLEYVAHKSMAKLYQSSDVFLLPSKSEGLSLSLLEALSSGLPVIATPQCRYKKIIQNGINGYCFEINDEGKWLQSLKNCFENKEKFGRKSRQKIFQYGLTEKEWIDKHEKLYYETIATK
jgi:1,2-diacylglycerol 3-alpha-glucosyltransferase